MLYRYYNRVWVNPIFHAQSWESGGINLAPPEVPSYRCEMRIANEWFEFGIQIRLSAFAA
jgi:hypothetical protein